MGFGYAQSPLPQGDRLSEDARMTSTIGTMRPALLALAMSLLAACSSPHAMRSNADDGKPPPMPFLSKQHPSRQDANIALGAPMREFPADRIAMWRIAEHDGEHLAAARADRDDIATHVLVVEFDATNIITRWSLVEQR